MATRTAVYREGVGCFVDDTTALHPHAVPAVAEVLRHSCRRAEKTPPCVVVAERYAEGFDADTPQLGWSMGKSIVNALAVCS
jgi:hypothetical protein